MKYNDDFIMSCILYLIAYFIVYCKFTFISLTVYQDHNLYINTKIYEFLYIRQYFSFLLFIFQSAIRKPKNFFTAPLTKYIFNYVRSNILKKNVLRYICYTWCVHVNRIYFQIFQMVFLTVLVMYSSFVLTSIEKNYSEVFLARVFEYFVYLWGLGDLIEETISCFVNIFESFKSIQ